MSEPQPDPIRLFVGTDPQQHIAERALMASVAKNTKRPVEITWMRQGDEGWDWGGPEAGWATPFTLFRYHIPRACDFKGRAIYVDVDMLMLGDIEELWEWDLEGKPAAATRRPEVIVWDCSKVDPSDFEGLATSKKQSHRGYFSRKACPKISQDWNVWDNLEAWEAGGNVCKLLHYTVLRTQPWKPYRKRFNYDIPHTCPKACALFWEYAKLGGVSDEIRDAIVRPDHEREVSLGPVRHGGLVAKL